MQNLSKSMKFLIFLVKTQKFPRFFVKHKKNLQTEDFYGIIFEHDMCRYALMREVAGRLSRGISAEYVRFINRAKKT